MRVGIALFLVGLLALLGPGSVEVWAAGHKFEVVDSDEIYYGEGKHPETPAATDADDVWTEIPEYKRIVANELDDDDPAYHILMKKATERFNKALKKLAERDDYDMIGETGSIKSIGDKDNKIPDVTKELVKLVTRD
ncbi:MAG: hypothetical protein ACYTGN_03540 [Planctomycetota bacterium]|jgi:hypothetical protein